jgi:hypothetical protein
MATSPEGFYNGGGITRLEPVIDATEVKMDTDKQVKAVLNGKPEEAIPQEGTAPETPLTGLKNWLKGFAKRP